MKRVILRNDLMKKSNYAKRYKISRVSIDKKIKEGDLVVERIDGTDYIRLKTVGK